MITFMLVLSRLQEPSHPLGRVSLLQVPYDLCKSHLWLSDLGWFPVGGKSIQETHCRLSWLEIKKKKKLGVAFILDIAVFRHPAQLPGDLNG